MLAVGVLWHFFGRWVEEAEKEAILAREGEMVAKDETQQINSGAEGVKMKYEWRIKDMQNLLSKCNGRLNVAVAGDGWWGYGYVRLYDPRYPMLVSAIVVEGGGGEVKKLKPFGGEWQEVKKAEGLCRGGAGDFLLTLR